MYSNSDIGGPNMILINTNTIIRIVLITLLIIKQNSAEYECNGFGIFNHRFQSIATLSVLLCPKTVP